MLMYNHYIVNLQIYSNQDNKHTKHMLLYSQFTKSCNPKIGFIVSCAAFKPVYKMNKATIIPANPSTGKVVNLDTIKETITTLVAIISEKLSKAVASSDTDFIFFEIL